MNIKHYFIKSYKGILLFSLFIFIIYLANKQTDKINREFCQKFKREKFSGRIEKKYIDKKEHNYKMLVISKDNGRDSSSYNNERSGFWDFVQINDSIIKKENSFEIYIIKKDTSFIIDFDRCK
jgi:hypothetical protein